MLDAVALAGVAMMSRDASLGALSRRSAQVSFAVYGCNVMQAESGLLGQVARTLGRIAATIAIAGVAALLVRYGFIERDDLGLRCQLAATLWWCDLRLLIVRAFLHGAFGFSSMVLAALAAWRRSALAAHLALASGTVGMVLYDFTGSGIGVLGGAMVLAGLQGERQQNGRAQQYAGRTPAD